MNISHAVIVLGKRLVNNQLTLEGQSRIDALIHQAERLNLAQSVVVLCGGRTSGQTVSEASAMCEALGQRAPDSFWASLPKDRLLVEDTSTNTIENVANAANTLVKSGLVGGSTPLNILFVSTDYHLKRIFEIEHWLPEQGLLGMMTQECARRGLSITICPQADAHVLAPYPYPTQGIGFLLCDALTTYRVYLEGVAAGKIDFHPSPRRQYCEHQAHHALEQLQSLTRDRVGAALLSQLEEALRVTRQATSILQIKGALNCFDQSLKALNRHWDPEQSHDVSELSFPDKGA